MRAMIALFQAEEFDAPGLAADLVVLTRQAERGFHAV